MEGITLEIKISEEEQNILLVKATKQELSINFCQ